MTRFVTGIGGLFFRSRDPGKLSAWYEEHFGIPAVGSQHVWKQESGLTVFSPFKPDTDYFGRPDQQFMVNFRVNDLDGFVEELKGKGVVVDPKRMEEPYGKFAWIYDPEGNKVELWEPGDPEAL